VEKGPARRWRMPIILLPIWGVITGLMMLSALLGLGCVVLGALSLFVDLSGLLSMRLGGEIVRTTTQKLLFMAVGAVMALAGIGFWRLNRRGYLVSPLICLAVLLGLFLVVALVAGRGDVISVGGP
jgi:hypothetical protein